ncbi:MAG: NAD-dependent epimerase/dehydratase family protein [Ignavibacteriae bacterium]|nr:NAD-dependent epimerase/dehydratase family protein [Ignavibacteriota bacterium]
MNILLTGGAGFIGSHIADLFISEGHDVIIIDNLSTGSTGNINKKARFIESDISTADFEKILRGLKIDVINHHAAQIDVRTSVADPITDLRANVEGTVRLLEYAVNNNVRKFMFASSGGAVYGEQKLFPADENHPKNPLSPYGISKLTAEKYIKFFSMYYGLPYSILRYANVYGPRQSLKGEAGVVAVFCKKLVEGKKAVINGDGKNTRDLVYAEDVAVANLKAMKSDAFCTVNISTAEETDINTVYEKIRNCFGSDAKAEHGAGIKGEQKRSIIDNSLALEIIGWNPLHNFERGIKKTCDWFKWNYKKN